MSTHISKLVNLAEMGQLDARVRARVKAWVSAQMTQAEFGRRIGRNDSWVSRYFDENHDADLDTIAKMAEACGHTIFQALDSQPDSTEAEVIERWRLLKPSSRKLALELLRDWTSSGGLGRTRARPAGK